MFMVRVAVLFGVHEPVGVFQEMVSGQQLVDGVRGGIEGFVECQPQPPVRVRPRADLAATTNEIYLKFTAVHTHQNETHQSL